MMDQNETKPRGPHAQALKQLDELKTLCSACALELERAASIRAGLMDSESRQLEVQRELRDAAARVAKRLREVQ